MSDLTDRCEQQAEMILCHGFKATHNLLLDCAAEIKRLTERIDELEAEAGAWEATAQGHYKEAFKLKGEIKRLTEPTCYADTIAMTESWSVTPKDIAELAEERMGIILTAKQIAQVQAYPVSSSVQDYIDEDVLNRIDDVLYKEGDDVS